MRRTTNQPSHIRQIGGLWKSCRVEIVSLGIALGLSGVAARILPPALSDIDAVGVSCLIFLIWGVICVAIYRILQRTQP